jgi:uncharacterized protein YkwD
MLRGSGRTRRSLRAGAVCVLALACFPAAAGSSAACREARASHGDRRTPVAISHTLRCYVNGERRKRRLPGLRPSRLLDRAAQRHADDMVARGYFSHLTPEGKTVDERARRAGYLRGAADWGIGEAIGYGTADVHGAVRLGRTFMASPAHRRILLDPRFARLGIGVAGGWPVAGKAGRGVTVVIDVGRARRAR